MQIRAAQNADAEEIKAVIFEVLREYGLQPDPAKTDKDLDSIEEFYHRNHGYFGVVESAGVIVATVGICRIDAHTCELRKMYSLPNQRGKGLGSTLMDFSISKAKKLGYKHIILETATPLIEAIALYKKYNFKEYSPSHLTFRCDKAFELFL